MPSIVAELIHLFFPKHRAAPAPTPATPQPSAPAQQLTIASIPTYTAPQQLVPPAPAPIPAQQPALPYRRIPQLLTPAERDLLAVLKPLIPPGFQLYAQVRLANLVEVLPHARRDKSHWYRIQAKCVDFVVCAEADVSPRLVIELDDRSHDRPDRRERDAFVDSVLATIGLPILHIRWQRRYDPAALAQQIYAAIGFTPPIPSAPQAPRNVPATALPPAAPEGFWHPIPQGSHPVVQPASPPIGQQSAHCGQCHAELRPHARFCSNCGATFSSA